LLDIVTGRLSRPVGDNNGLFLDLESIATM
jgi:hypothetical protein